MNVSLGVYGFVVSLVLAAAIAGGAVYISNLKRDLNVCKECRVWIKLAQLSKDAQLIKDENRRWTAGLVLLGILNSLCPKKKVWLKCETHNNVDTTALKTYTNEFNVVYRDAPNDPQTIQLNTLTKTEIFIQNGTVAVFDFRKNIGGFYSAEYNRCFLVGGIDARIKTPDDLKKELDSMTRNEQLYRSTETIDYEVSETAVTDQSFLPEALAPFCKGRPTYWLTPATGDHVKRMKRQVAVMMDEEGRSCTEHAGIEIKIGKIIIRF
ncbi:hypothetical protein NP493_1305g00027 [Ridgeia piscesae]|uniref:BRICHOS domain-containing protein n=1 Tax=Ridgeia piscesae TaxID=27915 RepID=A0AAD9NE01_RIDPI|nr:hypothetical protein NP493_1305g00027 [Ridgeia piscesae]